MLERTSIDDWSVVEGSADGARWALRLMFSVPLDIEVSLNHCWRRHGPTYHRSSNADVGYWDLQYGLTAQLAVEALIRIVLAHPTVIKFSWTSKTRALVYETVFTHRVGRDPRTKRWCYCARVVLKQSNCTPRFYLSTAYPVSSL